jgi:hypothetical protein
MARIPLIDPDDPNIDPDVREALLRSARADGGVPNILRARANHPKALIAGDAVAYTPGSLITPAQRELAYLTSSVVNSCHY